MRGGEGSRALPLLLWSQRADESTWREAHAHGISCMAICAWRLAQACMRPLPPAPPRPAPGVRRTRSSGGTTEVSGPLLVSSSASTSSRSQDSNENRTSLGVWG